MRDGGSDGIGFTDTGQMNPEICTAICRTEKPLSDVCKTLLTF